MSAHDGLPVHGYQPQSETRVDMVNQNKMGEELLLRRIEMLQSSGYCDLRWLIVAKTLLEQAFMAMNRAVFQPSRVSLPDDEPETASLGAAIRAGGLAEPMIDIHKRAK